MTRPKGNPLLETLRSKYLADPDRFRSFLPDVAQMLDAMERPRRAPRSPFGLTDRERTYHQQRLITILEDLDRTQVPRQIAVKAIEHCVALIQDDSLPERAGHAELSELVRSVTGKSPGSFKSVTKVPAHDDQEMVAEEAASHVSLLRGVVLDLDANQGLVSITITPAKVRERRKLLQFVGIGQDEAVDVASRHDHYLGQRSPHAAT